MIFIIGIFLLIIGIVIDDFSTIILLNYGFGILESNPIYRIMPGMLYFLSMIIFYILIMSSYSFLISKYKWFYEKRGIMYKLYDIFVFFACLIIVTISFAKIDTGINNLEIIKNHIKDNNYYNDTIEAATNLKNMNPEKYNQQMNNHYKDGILNGISYLQMIFNCLCAYLLFRVGFKVSPYYTKRNDE